MTKQSLTIHQSSALRDRVHVFRDRRHAGETLASMLKNYRGADALVLAIPAGGVPVAAAIAEILKLTLDVVPVSKVLYPWTTEAGFGAVAYDGSEWLNDTLLRHTGLTQQQIRDAVTAAREKVRRRLERFRGDRPLPALADRSVILVDDGIAAGSTMRVAIAALNPHRPREIIVAIPTGHDRTLAAFSGEPIAALYCANVRSGPGFAVADAYRNWHDVSDAEVAELLGSV